MYMYVRTLWKNHAIYILAGVLFFFWYFQCEFHSFAFYLLNAENNFSLVGFVDCFAENKEAVVNHGRKLLKVGVGN